MKFSIQSFVTTIMILCFFNAFAAETIRTNPLPNTVSLTFDDGPNPIYTRQILDILRKNHIKATFFMVGANAKLYPDVVKKIAADGHVIAQHSMTHPMLTKLSASQLQYEVATPVAIIDRILGIKPRCLRYPFGASNEHVREVIRQNGMAPVPMGFNSFDYERPGTAKIISWVNKNLYSKQVLLFHDGYDRREQTVAALQPIIDAVKKKGLGFSTIC